MAISEGAACPQRRFVDIGDVDEIRDAIAAGDECLASAVTDELPGAPCRLPVPIERPGRNAAWTDRCDDDQAVALLALMDFGGDVAFDPEVGSVLSIGRNDGAVGE